MSKNTMRAVILDVYDGFEKLRVGAVEAPVPGAEQLLVHVRAAGVNHSDIAMAAGLMQRIIPLDLPVIAGVELAGTVVAVGDQVGGWAVGDAVHALLLGAGAFAEYACVSAASAVRLPERMSFAEAAALPVATAAATAALDKGEVGSGTRLVVHGASGGVGSIVVQIAKARGAHVTAFGSPSELDFIAALGADVVVDRTSEEKVTINDADIVIDCYGPATHKQSWPMLRPGGALLSLNSEPSEEKAAAYGVRGYRIFGTGDRSALETVDALYAVGKLKVRVGQQFPLEQALDAYRALASHQSTGKIVIDVNSEQRP